jgi:GT2 family glycosyltransferase|nr:MAG: glycosyl transferase family 2 [bacterium]
MSSPRLSILLPCRDAARYVGDAIASLEAQTFTDYEVLAVDDGSADGTAGLLEAWAARDPRVRVIRTPRRGLVPALAAALAAARGEFIARMDADDVAEPERFARQVALLDARPDVVACGTRVRYFPREAVRDGARRYERWLNSLIEPEDLARDIFVECPIAHPALVARRAAVLAVGGYRDPGWPEDYDLVLRLWAAGGRLANMPEVLLHWRERPDRTSRTDPRYSPDAFRRCKVHHLRRTLLRAAPGGAGGARPAPASDGSGAPGADEGPAPGAGDVPAPGAGCGPGSGRDGGHAASGGGDVHPGSRRGDRRAAVRPAVVWGAGPVGKGFARELLRQGVPLAAFVDLDPRKIGQAIYGAPVVSPAQIHRFRGALALAAVGSPGARDEIRAALTAAGWREGADFVAVA